MLALVPGAAWAEACDKVRPNWDGTHVNMLDEVVQQISNPLTAPIVFLSILLVFQKNRILPLFGVLLIGSYAVVTVDPAFLNDVTWAAKQEGCIGNQELWWATLVGILLLGLYRTARKFMIVSA